MSKYNKFEENVLLHNKHILLHDDTSNSLYTDDIKYVKDNFCGSVVDSKDSFDNHTYSKDRIIYMYGNIEDILKKYNLKRHGNIKVIEELSNNYIKENTEKYNLINMGEVPINMHNTGVFFRHFFNTGKNYYNSITDEHEFQLLTQSNKPQMALRKGIYLTKVEENKEELEFKLLRCSTNFRGPTDNFRDTDNEIIDKVNNISKYFYKNHVKLNHVLAQTYHNSTVLNGDRKKERKAKIKEHSDKTKDMPKDAIMAFCSFYKDYRNWNNYKKSSIDPYDYCYNKKTSILTKLRFRLKKEVTDETMQKKFDIILYPNSVFLMSLLTNRLYTHEIIPSNLPIDKIPTRMGYVIRCSNTNAVYKDDQTYIIKNNIYHKLKEQTEDGVKELKELYVKENRTIEMVDYEDKFFFSLNDGDYTRPII